MTGDSVSALHDWLQQVTFDDLPDDVHDAATSCFLDLVAVAAAGRGTTLSRIACDHAVAQFAPGPGTRGARILFDGRVASAAGAALAGGMTIDSVDAHDGHALTKGHAGVAVLPALLALADAADGPPDGRELLTTLVIGYEVAIRAGIALHATASDYHTSGAWNALGVVAVANRLWRCDERHLREALGIAEYHGPRSPMMRCIDHPTMLKDGSGWGAMTGVSAAQLALAGFTGAPADTVAGADAGPLWSDLGRRWRVLELYFKPYPVCRWAQPAIAAALQVRAVDGGLAAHDVVTIDVTTFHEATRLDHPEPATTEQAQYSLPFPVAVALVRGRVAVADIDGAALSDPEVLALSRAVRLVEDPALSARFPAERLARATVRLRDGSMRTSEVLPAHGGAESPLTAEELAAKFHELAGEALGPRTAAVETGIRALHRGGDTSALLDQLLRSG